MEYLAPMAGIKVVGVGGAGCNAVSRMVQMGVKGVEFIAINTDAQALFLCDADKRVHIGGETTKGLGAGANPDIGRAAVEENKAEIRGMLQGADMVFITCGMGGGTGTGASPIVAEVAREVGALTVAIVTKPFSFEGQRRKKTALEGINAIKDKVDALITISNDRLLMVANKGLAMVDAFRMADDVLRCGVQGISEIITVRGLINVDFADVQSVLANSGSAIIGIGKGKGERRATEAAKAAISSPLLETTFHGARGILFNITGGEDLTLFEIDEAAKIVSAAADPDANIIFGSVVDPRLEDEVMITVLASGFVAHPEQADPMEAAPEMLVAARSAEVGIKPFLEPSFYDEPAIFRRKKDR
ncbi:MAG TPA: cell division protein FtsZ [Candidatus Xenobia bacterium]